MCQIVVTESTKAPVVVSRQAENTNNDVLAVRLKEARRALSLTQAEFGALGGVSTNTQNRYESGTLPPVDYLMKIGEAGADWYWILTGQRITGATLDERSAELVRLFQAAPISVQTTILMHMRAVAEVVGSTAPERSVGGKAIENNLSTR